jgi:hypothetical protein
VEGWCSVEELVQWGFTHASVVMANLCQLTAAAPGEPLLVWCGNGHASKGEFGEWIPMGWHFRTMSDTDPFVIDQTVTVAFQDPPQPWVQPLLAELGETLAAHGGTAGILQAQAPAPLDCRDYVDAVVVSTENTLSEALLPGTANP